MEPTASKALMAFPILFASPFVAIRRRRMRSLSLMLLMDYGAYLWSRPELKTPWQEARGPKGMAPLEWRHCGVFFGDLGRGWELSFDRLSWNELIYNDASDKNYHLELLHLLIQLSNRSMLILFWTYSKDVIGSTIASEVLRNQKGQPASRPKVCRY